MSKKDIQLLIGLAGVLIAIGVFFLAYKPTMEKVDAMKAENETLTTRAAELQSLVDQKDYFLTETEKNDNEVRKTYDLFPADYRFEDALSTGMDMESVSPLVLSKIDFSEKVEFYHPLAYESKDVVLPVDTTAATDPAAATAETTETDAATAADAATTETTTAETPAAETVPVSPLVAYIQTVDYTTASTYEGMKRGIEFLSNTDNRQVISKISLVYDPATGQLAGTTTMSVYYITGTPKEYVAPILPSVPIGTDDIFSTVSSSDDNARAESEDEDAEDEEDTEEDED